MRLYLVFAAAIALAAPQAACQPKVVPAPAKPKRPKAKPINQPGPAVADCTVAVIEQSPPAVPYKARVIVESNNLSRKGIKLLSDAAKDGLEPELMESMFIEGVEDLLTSLKADPYNVDATYHLAAAYARIDRRQCTINLLDRLSLLRRLASHRPTVERRVDQLLGRNGKPLDSSFDPMRADERFRDVVEKLIAPL